MTTIITFCTGQCSKFLTQIIPLNPLNNPIKIDLFNISNSQIFKIWSTEKIRNFPRTEELVRTKLGFKHVFKLHFDKWKREEGKRKEGRWKKEDRWKKKRGTEKKSRDQKRRG